jgi:HPt (histidine-containing phosphotransfer) domain-containing protein
MIDAAFAPAQGAPDTAPLRKPEPPREPEPLRELELLREPGAFESLVHEIGEDGAGEVQAVFLNETSARLELFRALALDQHRARIAREAHSLKSTARTFGYLRLATLALLLESKADALGDAEFYDLLQQMDAAFAGAKALESQD